MDLNLLTALDALLEENSVQAAADRLHLSAPAMSRTLSRIRATTGDDILVRTGRTMTPTPRALEIRDEVRELVSRATAVLAQDLRLDLGELRRVFTIRGNDALLAALAPSLVRDAAPEATRVSFRMLGEASLDDASLAHGHVDLDLGSGVPSAPEISHEVLGEDHLVVVMRDGHPLADRLDAASYASADHLILSRRGKLGDDMDAALEGLGLHRRVVGSLPNVGLVLTALEQSDLVCLMPDRATAMARKSHRVTHRTPPLPAPTAPVIMSWHSRYDSDPAHRWMRDHSRAALHAMLQNEDGRSHSAS